MMMMNNRNICKASILIIFALLILGTKMIASEHKYPKIFLLEIYDDKKSTEYRTSKSNGHSKMTEVFTSTATEYSTTTIGYSTIVEQTVSDGVTTTSTENSIPGKPCNMTESVNGAQIVWDKKVEGDFYYARPHCIGSNDLPKTRRCINGEFEDQGSCEKIQEKITYCPNDFQEVGLDCCKILPDAPENESRCPYKNNLDFVYHNCNFSSSWFPALRDSKYGLGEFVFRDLSERHGLIFSSVIYDVNPFQQCNCTTLKPEGTNESVFAVPCDTKNKRLCSYSTLERAQNTYCRSTDYCINKSFDHNEKKCICIKSNTSSCTLAELEEEFQNSIFEVSSESCLIPLHYTGTELKWTITNNHVNYTFWSNEHLINGSNKIFLSGSSNGWVENKKQNCRICEITYEIEKPDVFLHYNKSLQVICLNVTNMKSIASPPSWSKMKIWCFSDSVPDHLFNIVHIIKGDTTQFPVSKSGNYWCEFYYLDGYSLGYSNNILIINENIFGIRVEMSFSLPSDPTSSGFANSKIQLMKENFNSHNNNKLKVSLKWMKTFYLNDTTVEYLVHICTIQNETSYQLEFEYIKDHIDNFTIDGGKPSSELRNVAYCLESTTHKSGQILTWPITPYGNQAVSKELCIDQFGQEVKRRCEGDFFEGANWDDVTEMCLQLPRSDHSGYLEELLKRESNPDIIIEKITEITNKCETFVTTDVYLTGMILKKIRDEIVINQTIEIFDNLMKTRLGVIEEAQENFNSSDLVLRTMDYIFLKEKNNYTNQKFYRKNINSFIYNIKAFKLFGLALIKNDEYEIIEIDHAMNRSEISSIPNLEVAFYIPKEVLEEIEKTSDATIVSNIFMESNLFFDFSNRTTSFTKNFGILLPDTKLIKPIELYYKIKEGSDLHCGFWKYNDNSKGHWVSEKQSIPLEYNIHLCYFDHVTHFGLLVMNSKDLPNDDTVIVVISIIGCSLSMVGALGIFATAILFREWRYNKSNAIILSYSTVTFIQIISLFISYYIPAGNDNRIFCISVGIVLHYTTISQFCWMFVFAFLQYQRYTKVLNISEDWVMVKAGVFSFLLPFIPITFLLLLFKDNYNKVQNGLCYPSDDGLLYTVLLPILVILSFNISVVVKIYVDFFCRGENIIKNEIFAKKIRVIIFLFFMLGLTWSFGILAEFFESLSLLYLFCISASGQCFIIFIFFIGLSKRVRKMYFNLYLKLFKKK